MARLIAYGRENIPDENDILIGTDAQTKQSKNFVLGNLKTYFNEGIETVDTFEVFSKNLKQYPYTINYTGDLINNIVYATNSGNIIKTFTFTDNKLSLITLSGSIDASIDKNKQFNYTSGKLTSVTYF